MNIKLFNGEEIKYRNASAEYLTEKQINEKYIKGEIRIVTEQGRYPLEEVARMFSNKEKYDDNMVYQRNYVWSNKMKSLLIESFIMNIPIPPIFLYEKDYSYYEILDGKQRISSIVDFYKNEYKLEGLEVWGSLNGYFYRDLPIRIKEGLDRRYLSSVIMLKESEKDSFEMSQLIKIVFERLNTGGLKLSTQEARNAIYGGPFNDMCKELAESDQFQFVWHQSTLPKPLFHLSTIDKTRMADSEIVLRFFAFRHLSSFESNLNVFLDQYLDRANKYDADLIGELKNLFIETLAFAIQVFDGKPFRVFRASSQSFSNNPDRFIYDAVMSVLSQKLDFKEIILEKREYIQKKFAEAMATNASTFNGKLQHRAYIEKRMDIFSGIIEAAIGEKQ